MFLHCKVRNYQSIAKYPNMGILSYQHHKHDTENDEQGVGHGIGDGITHGWYRATQTLLNGTESGSRFPGSGTAAKSYRGMELEHLVAEEKCDEER